MRGTVFKCWIKRVPVALLNLCPHNNGLCCWELFESHLKGHSSSNPSFIPPWPGLAQLIRLLLLQDLLEIWVEGWQRIGNWRRPLLRLCETRPFQCLKGLLPQNQTTWMVTGVPRYATIHCTCCWSSRTEINSHLRASTARTKDQEIESREWMEQYIFAQW